MRLRVAEPSVLLFDQPLDVLTGRTFSAVIKQFY